MYMNTRRHNSSSKKGKSNDKEVTFKHKVLIVVDVQNCFFDNFGTLGWMPKDTDDAATRDSIKKTFIIRLRQFIKKAIKNYDLIIFTKDRHPINHRSFGTYPPHCINKTKKCKFTAKLDITKRKRHIQDLFNKNTGHKLILIEDDDLEKLLYDYKISFGDDINKELGITTLSKLNLNGKIKYETVTSTKSKSETCDVSTMKLKPHITDKADIVRLNKGELCNFDAYGAFLYHIQYKDNPDIGRKVHTYETKYEFDPSGETNILDDLEANDITDITKISTGLGEFLLKYYNYNFSPDMVIDVCGLVTNICVVNSCIGGIKFFENYKTLKPQHSSLHIPHFRILNEFSLYLYLFPLSETDCLDKSNISYKIYPNQDEYDSNDKKYKEQLVSIIGTPAADNYIPNK